MGPKPWGSRLDQILSNICTIPMLVDRLAQQVMLQPTRNDAETIKV
jgi:hypothetical protein